MANVTDPLPAGYLAVGSQESPSDPNFGWRGTPVNGDKSAEGAVRRRRTQFKSLEEFAAWRRSKNFPALSQADLEAAFARFKGEAPGEKAIANQVLEHR